MERKPAADNTGSESSIRRPTESGDVDESYSNSEVVDGSQFSQPESPIQTEVLGKFPCKLCPVQFRSQLNLNAHRKLENAHPQLRIKLMKMARRTEKDGRIFTLKNSTCKANTSTQQWYICVHCGRGSKNPETARIHHQVHSDVVKSPALTLSPLKRVQSIGHKLRRFQFQQPPIIKSTNPSEVEVLNKEELTEVDEILPTSRDSDMEVDPCTIYVESAMKFNMDLENPQATEMSPQADPLLLPAAIVAQLSTAAQPHSPRRHEQLKYVCSTCGKRFQCPALGKRHLEGVPSPRILRSRFCQRTFWSRGPKECHEAGHWNMGTCVPAPTILLDASDRNDTDSSDPLERSAPRTSYQFEGIMSYQETIGTQPSPFNTFPKTLETIGDRWKDFVKPVIAARFATLFECKLCFKKFRFPNVRQHVVKHIQEGELIGESQKPRTTNEVSMSSEDLGHPYR